MAAAHDFDSNPEVSGVLVKVDEEVGPNGSMLFTLQQKDGTEVAVWGSAILDDLMRKVMTGEEVRIVCTGKQVSPKTKRTYRTYVLMHRQMSV